MCIWHDDIKKQPEAGLVTMAVILALGKWRQEEQEFEISLD